MKIPFILKMNSRKTQSLYAAGVCGMRVWQLSSDLGGQSEDKAKS